VCAGVGEDMVGDSVWVRGCDSVWLNSVRCSGRRLCLPAWLGNRQARRPAATGSFVIARDRWLGAVEDIRPQWQRALANAEPVGRRRRRQLEPEQSRLGAPSEFRIGAGGEDAGAGIASGSEALNGKFACGCDHNVTIW